MMGMFMMIDWGGREVGGGEDMRVDLERTLKACRAPRAT